MILDKGKKNIGVLGISFKKGTDDLRNSPIVEVIEKLSAKGYNAFLVKSSWESGTLLSRRVLAVGGNII